MLSFPTLNPIPRSCSSVSLSPSSAMAATSEKQLQITKQESFGEGLYKTKIIEFLGRSIPIILQSDNGPCPLLAICNVLLLRNILNLSLDTTEISLKRLLSLVAERLIDSNSNTENRDDGYVQNQQQNIGDAIDLLPRLATGIDVNVRFRNVYDFEFTPECAIFDLLDIGLVHGWIFDPQDVDTATVIGSNSYNTLMEKLVALETRNPDGVYIRNLEEDCIDFAAATTAALGVPSPSLSRGRSFDCPLIPPISCDQGGRKGDIEEVEELIRVLDLSRADLQGKMDVSLSSGTNPINSSTNSDGSFHLKSSRSGAGTNSSQVPTGDEYKRSYELEVFKSEEKSISSSCDYNDGLSSEIISKETEILSKIPARNQLKESITNESGGHLMEDRPTDVQVQDQGLPFLFPDRRDVSAAIPPFHLKPNDDCRDYGSTAFPDASPKPRSPFSNGKIDSTDVPEDMSSSIEDSEPIYEGEDCILDSIPGVYEDREPMYEGEIILTEQTNGGEKQDGNGVRQENNQTEESCGASLSLTAREGELIQNFLKNNASQLTVYGLFCLQEGLKERELCVFFRNNHFSTLFKFNGDLYLLATDQGYINQPDLVWEKLNEVNGDTVFMTGNFREFKAENQGNGTWDEQNAMTSTADYLASMDKSAPTDSTFNSDLQLAIALQQQEYEHQPKRQRPHNLQQSSGVVGASRLVTGPEVSRGSSRTTSRQETKNKDKCVVM